MFVWGNQTEGILRVNEPGQLELLELLELLAVAVAVAVEFMIPTCRGVHGRLFVLLFAQGMTGGDDVVCVSPLVGGDGGGVGGVGGVGGAEVEEEVWVVFLPLMMMSAVHSGT